MKKCGKAAYKGFHPKGCLWSKGASCGNGEQQKTPDVCVQCIMYQLQKNFVIAAHFNETIFRAAAGNSYDREFFSIVAVEQAEKFSTIHRNLNALTDILTRLMNQRSAQSNLGKQSYVS